MTAISRGIAANWPGLWIALVILLTVVLMTGLLHRERHGIGNLDVESVLLLIVYSSGVAALAFGG